MRRYGFKTGLVDFGRDTTGDTTRASSLEWLATNGVGGYACGTVSGILTRRWHGLLVAATDPPAGRTMMLAKLDPEVTYRGVRYQLGNNRFKGGVVQAPGLPNLIRFHLEQLVPTWTWCLRDAIVEQRVFMKQGENTTCVHWHFVQGTSELRLRLGALVCFRPHDRLTPPGAPGPVVEQAERGVRISWRAHGGASTLFVQGNGAVPSPGSLWWHDFELPVEASLGYDSLDNHFHAATLEIVLAPGASTIVTASTRSQPAADADAALESERSRCAAILGTAQATEAAPGIQHLVLGASQFVVERPIPSPGGAKAGAGHSIIAGYPWFADWSRDTLISLPGLLLATGRPEIASSILRTLAAFLEDGLLPNRFPAPGESRLDNSVDAPLLFIDAVHRVWRHTKDDSLPRDLAPTMLAIVDAFTKGTRHGIGMDPRDGLIVATEPGVQLTWMDAKVGDRVVTPRMGKPVEINALWHSALLALAEMASPAGSGVTGSGLPGVDAAALEALAARVKSSFGRFWSPRLNCLLDTIDGPNGDEALVRPNQLFAVSLGRELVPPLQSKAIVERAMLDLWMPLGVRTLAPGSPGYEPSYGGPLERRDQAYHNGTAWPWLFGPLMHAHDRVHGDHDAVADFLHPFVNHLREACLGQVGEVFDAEPPHRPGGCFAQAWSVGELLDLWQLCRA